mgnify:CR=1 FL=1
MSATLVCYETGCAIIEGGAYIASPGTALLAVALLTGMSLLTGASVLHYFIQSGRRE